MATVLKTLRQVAGETGLTRQALERHYKAGHIEADFIAKGAPLFKPGTVETIKWQLCTNRLLRGSKK